MKSLIKNSKLVIIEKCGHLPQEEMPERVLDEVTAFIGLALHSNE
jgi:pimeloyl-ACP methyl ester carboxylesterase